MLGPLRLAVLTNNAWPAHGSGRNTQFVRSPVVVSRTGIASRRLVCNGPFSVFTECTHLLWLGGAVCLATRAQALPRTVMEALCFPRHANSVCTVAHNSVPCRARSAEVATESGRAGSRDLSKRMLSGVWFMPPPRSLYLRALALILRVKRSYWHAAAQHRLLFQPPGTFELVAKTIYRLRVPVRCV